MWGRASSLLCGCYHSVSVRVFSPALGVEALRVRFNKASLPLSVWLLKQVRSMQSQWTYVPPIQVSAVPLRNRESPVVFIPDLVQCCGLEVRVLLLQELKWLCCHLRSALPCGWLLPEPVCPRSSAKLPCGVSGAGCSCWETNYWARGQGPPLPPRYKLNSLLDFPMSSKSSLSFLTKGFSSSSPCLIQPSHFITTVIFLKGNFDICLTTQKVWGKYQTLHNLTPVLTMSFHLLPLSFLYFILKLANSMGSLSMTCFLASLL